MADFNLRAWCNKFIDSKYNDVKLMEIAALVRKEAKLNGYTDKDVSEMYRTINKERKHTKEQVQKAQEAIKDNTQHTTPNESSNRRTEPNRKPERAFNNDNTDSVRSPSGTRARKTESMILKLAGE